MRCIKKKHFGGIGFLRSKRTRLISIVVVNLYSDPASKFMYSIDNYFLGETNAVHCHGGHAIRSPGSNDVEQDRLAEDDRASLRKIRGIVETRIFEVRPSNFQKCMFHG